VEVATRWESGGGPRGDDYDERWRRMAAAGHEVHGEADLVDQLLSDRARGGGDAPSVLDAGCGTGRVAVELARRGYRTVGVDLDASMLDTARAKAPDLEWVEADLDGLALAGDGSGRAGPRRFDAVVAAGNVMIFLARGSEGRVLASLAAHLEAGGLLIAGFQLGDSPRSGPRLGLDRYDEVAAAAGLTLQSRWSTWARAPFVAGGDYAVSVHRAA
jgi:SAM-dependent methyltransferase